jgi:hypothetical protein
MIIDNLTIAGLLVSLAATGFLFLTIRYSDNGS